MAAVAAMLVGNVGITALVTAPADNQDSNPVAADDYDELDEGLTGAGGGGWFKYNGAKDTFGFYLNSSDIAMSEFVLHARDAGVTVHAIEFNSITFNYDADLGIGGAEAYGTANVSGVVATLHLIVEDNGPRSMDRLMVELSGDYSGLWDITGIGGQIWVYLE